MKSDSSSSTPPVGGIEQAHVIDLIAHDPRTDVVTMTMVERRVWDHSDLQLFQLQEKFNAYVSFALDGELSETYPALCGKALRLRLECAEAPNETVRTLLVMIREQIAFQGIDVEVVVTGGNCGPNCACAN